MEPIISPWIIYFAGIANPLKFALGCITVVGIIFVVVLAVTYNLNEPDSGYNEANRQKCIAFQKAILRYLKLVIIITVVTFLLCVLIPDKDTIIAMVVANMVTIDNLQSTNDFVKSNVQDYVNMIVNAINQVK